MDELMEAFVKGLFKNPTFRENLMLFITDTVKGGVGPEVEDIERICKNVLRDCTISIVVD